MTSQVVQIATTIGVSAATLAAASTGPAAARWALPKTAAIATHAFGLATPSSAPPATEKPDGAAAGSASGGAVAMWYASQRMYAPETQTRTGPIAGSSSSAAVIPVATAT